MHKVLITLLDQSSTFYELAIFLSFPSLIIVFFSELTLQFPKLSDVNNT